MKQIIPTYKNHLYSEVHITIKTKELVYHIIGFTDLRIKMSGGELRGHAHVSLGLCEHYNELFIYMDYMDGSCKILKCCSSTIITASYHLVYYIPSTLLTECK